MLFQSDDLHIASDPITRVFPGGDPAAQAATGALKSFIPNLEHGKVYHYVNRARWSMHDLVRFLIQATGPAQVWLTTWSMTTGPAGFLIGLKNAGQITSISAILSSRIRVNCPEALQLLTYNKARVKLAELHAKVLVIRNDSWSVTVTGSQNWSNIKRIEAGVIDTSAQAADAHIQWIENEIDRTQPGAA